MTDAHTIVIRPAELPRRPWKNGAGTTVEIATGPVLDGKPLWRFSTATLTDRTTRFSSFDGMDRVFTAIGDVGVHLTFAKESHVALPWEPVRFDGTDGPLCTPEAATNALNAMVDYQRASVDVEMHDLRSASVSTDARHITFALVRSGRAAAGTSVANRGECLLARACGDAWTGDATILIARVIPRTMQ